MSSAPKTVQKKGNPSVMLKVTHTKICATSNKAAVSSGRFVKITKINLDDGDRSVLLEIESSL